MRIDYLNLILRAPPCIDPPWAMWRLRRNARGHALNAGAKLDSPANEKGQCKHSDEGHVARSGNEDDAEDQEDDDDA